jgi:hypothetical protein
MNNLLTGPGSSGPVLQKMNKYTLFLKYYTFYRLSVLILQKAFVRLYLYFFISYLFNIQQHEDTGLYQSGR